MSRIIIAVTALLMANPAVAQTCKTIGATTYCDNGLSGERRGDTIYWNNGTTSTRIGNSLHNNDGSSATIIGDQTYFNRGTPAKEPGPKAGSGTPANETGRPTGSGTGRICTTTGATTVCN